MRILIVDDHALFAAGLKGVLTTIDGESVDTETRDSIDAAVNRLTDADFDLVLLDLFMPGAEGVSGVRRLAEVAPTVPIVVVSASEEPIHAASAIDAGAAGYITKSVSPDILIGHLVSVVRDGETVLAGVETQSDGKMPLSRLTARQRDIALCIGEGLSNRQIADQLGITEGTVKLHVSSIFKTLGLKNRSGLARLLNPGRQS